MGCESLHTQCMCYKNKLDDRSYRGYFMQYSDTTGVIIYWKLYHPFVIHRSRHAWYDEYNYRLSIEDEHNPGSLLLKKYSESHIHNSDVLNLIPCDLDITSTTFSDTTILTCDI